MTEKLRKKKKRGKNRWVVNVCPTHDQLDGASVTYQAECVKCGKPKCSKWHGPYWYAYWSSGGKTRSLYIGKLLQPAAVVANAKNAKAKAKRRAASKVVSRMKQIQLPHTEGVQS